MFKRGLSNAVNIPFLLDAAAVLAAFIRPITSLVNAHWGLCTYPLPATPSRLGI